MEVADNDVNISITFDNYPEETSLQITNSNGSVVASGGTMLLNQMAQRFLSICVLLTIAATSQFSIHTEMESVVDTEMDLTLFLLVVLH